MGLRDFFSRLRERKSDIPERMGVEILTGYETYRELNDIVENINKAKTPGEIYTNTMRLIGFLKRKWPEKRAERVAKNVAKMYEIAERFRISAETFKDDEMAQEDYEWILSKFKQLAMQIYAMSIKDEDVGFAPVVVVNKNETYIDTLSFLERSEFLERLESMMSRMEKKE